MRNRFINKKKIISALFILLVSSLYGQVRIAVNPNNTSAPNSSAFIDASSNNQYNLNNNLGKGLLYPRTDLNLFTTFGGGPGFGIPNNYPYRYDGFMLYNTATSGVAGVGSTEGTLCRGFWYYDNASNTINGGTWRPVRPELCSKPAIVTDLNCGSSRISGTLTQGTDAVGVSVSVPYTGGNGAAYSSQTVPSTGEGGLTANLIGGTLANGNGSLTYSITGRSTSSGTASFEISIGEKKCTLSIPVVNSGPFVGSLNCAGAIISFKITSGVSAVGTTIDIPYTEGNGNPYSGLVINAIGVTGDLKLVIPSGVLANGSGVIKAAFIGTPTSSGTASFNISIGEKKCILSIPVIAAVAKCGAYIAPGVFKEFGCYNLGARDTTSDPFIPTQFNHGDKYQWGTSTPSVTEANDSAFQTVSWNTALTGLASWVDGIKGTGDPCPAGFRIPSISEWEAVAQYNVLGVVGATNNDITNFGAGVTIGDKLMLPMAGERETNGFSGNTGLIIGRGRDANYQSANSYSGLLSHYMRFTNFLYPKMRGDAIVEHNTDGYPIRCIKE